MSHPARRALVPRTCTALSRLSIVYSLSGGADRGKFALKTVAVAGKDLAEITTLVPLDFEDGQTEFLLVVRATSGTFFRCVWRLSPVAVCF